MPRPIAAGVLGMARTTLPPQTCSSEAMVVPAMIETTSVDGADERFQRRRRLRGTICGFSATTSVAAAPASFGDGLRRTPLAASARDLVGRMRLDHDDAFGIEPLRQPARQHRAAHLARAGEDDGACDALRVR